MSDEPFRTEQSSKYYWDKWQKAQKTDQAEEIILLRQQLAEKDKELQSKQELISRLAVGTVPIEDLVEEHEKLVAAQQHIEDLETGFKDIRDNYGKVCSNFETCHHESCRSSYSSWSIACKQLGGQG